MLRSFQRATLSSTSSIGLLTRTNIRNPAASTAIFLCNLRQRQTRQATTHAISNPTLVDIEKRWVAMPPEEQAELWMALRDRMKNDWNDLTLQERKAAYFIAFGPHGPRAMPPPGLWWWITKWTIGAFILSGILLWITKSLMGPAPVTMNKEWQEATNEYLKKQRVEPITGISSEGYKGKGYVQSPPKKD